MSESPTFFLVIEGLDGSGKSEISRRLATILRETMGDRVMLTYEPHDPSAAGLFIRQVLTRKVNTSPRALALAYALNRYDHNERIISPFFDAADDRPGAQRIVICDRYTLSSLVYQSVVPLTMADVWALNAAARRPDLTLFMDASAATCYRRLGKRGGERELFDSNLSQRREKYLQGIAFLRENNHQVIEVDANPDLIDVINSIIDVLKMHGPSWLTMQRLLLLEDAVPPFDVARAVDGTHLIARARQAVRASGVSLAAALTTEVNAMLPAELAGLALSALELAGYAVGQRFSFDDAPLYPLSIDLPAGVPITGAIALLPETGRSDVITRALQFLETEPTARGCTYLLAFDPGMVDAPIRQMMRESGTPLSLSTRIFGRRFIVDQLCGSRQPSA